MPRIHCTIRYTWRVLLLFDIDGTLITSFGAGMRAMDDAFQRIYGMAGASRPVRPDGKTDPAIIAEMIEVNLGRAARPGEIGHMLPVYLECLREHIWTTERFALLPGLPDVLDTLRSQGHVLGLATGNVEIGARIKLRRARVDHYFDFGGFACDHADRIELTRAGIARGCRVLGRELAPDDVAVIGDTPRDIAAAHGAGARAFAVATGGHNLEALRAAGADVTLATLQSLPVALAAFSAGRRQTA